MNIEIITSEDGSHTLFLPHLKETYHSLHGALRESSHVFINSGLALAAETKNEITVLEIGFGTGLNALLCIIFAEATGKKIHYHTLEPHSLGKEIYEKLNYLDLLGRKDLHGVFADMHISEDGAEVNYKNLFFFKRYLSRLENFQPAGISPDVVFYDAFAPSKQPEVWSLENLKKVNSMMPPSGILVTYCASGQFKRDLKEAGFLVEVLPGPPGKKEMTRGRCKPQS